MTVIQTVAGGAGGGGADNPLDLTDTPVITVTTALNNARVDVQLTSTPYTNLGYAVSKAGNRWIKTRYLYNTRVKATSGTHTIGILDTNGQTANIANGLKTLIPDLEDGEYIFMLSNTGVYTYNADQTRSMAPLKLTVSNGSYTVGFQDSLNRPQFITSDPGSCPSYLMYLIKKE